MPTRRTLLLAASVLSALSACMFGADFDELRASSSDGNDDGEGRTLVAAGADKQLSGAPTVKLGIGDETATAAYDLFYDDVVVVVGNSDFSQGI